MYSCAVREAAGAVLDWEVPCKVTLGVEEELFPVSCDRKVCLRIYCLKVMTTWFCWGMSSMVLHGPGWARNDQAPSLLRP